MDNQVIPAQAVEAAAKAIRDDDWPDYEDQIHHPIKDYMSNARAALEAAAPHMQANAAPHADLTELARLLLKDAYELQSQPGMKDVCQHLTDAAIALDAASKRAMQPQQPQEPV